MNVGSVREEVLIEAILSMEHVCIVYKGIWFKLTCGKALKLCPMLQIFSKNLFSKKFSVHICLASGSQLTHDKNNIGSRQTWFDLSVPRRSAREIQNKQTLAQLRTLTSSHFSGHFHLKMWNVFYAPSSPFGGSIWTPRLLLCTRQVWMWAKSHCQVLFWWRPHLKG